MDNGVIKKGLNVKNQILFEAHWNYYQIFSK